MSLEIDKLEEVRAFEGANSAILEADFQRRNISASQRQLIPTLTHLQHFKRELFQSDQDPGGDMDSSQAIAFSETQSWNLLERDFYYIQSQTVNMHERIDNITKRLLAFIQIQESRN